MEIVIDIGNTRVKIAQFINSGIHKVWRVAEADHQLINELYEINPKAMIVSSVKGVDSAFKRSCLDIAPTIFLDANTDIPIRNDYLTPDTLGKDRLAAVVGARFLYPDQNCLAIDAGTCITYDLITKDGVYLGGNISPGLWLRSRALDEFTGALPLVKEYPTEILYGTSTDMAIGSGVFNGLVHEVNGTIAAYSERYENLHIVLCGGEARYLVNHLKYEIFANQNLVLIGLHKILLHNDI